MSDLAPENLANLCKFFRKDFHETTKNVSSVADLFGILSDNPDERSSGIRLVKFINALTQSGNDAFVSWVFPEDIFDHDDGLLNNIIDLCSYQIKQSVDTFLARALDLDCDLTNCFHGPLDDIHVNFQRVFFEFRKELINVLIV